MLHENCVNLMTGRVLNRTMRCLGGVCIQKDKSEVKLGAKVKNYIF